MMQGTGREHRHVVATLRRAGFAGPLAAHSAAEGGCLESVDSLSELFGPLLRGVPCVILPRRVTRNAESLADALDAQGVTRLFGVTSLVRGLLAVLDIYLILAMGYYQVLRKTT